MNSEGRTLISLSGVSKVFTTDEVETHALAGIELHIRKGEYISISGPSGCGKSTLLAILGLLDTPSSGNYALNDTKVDQMKLSERARVADVRSADPTGLLWGSTTTCPSISVTRKSLPNRSTSNAVPVATTRRPFAVTVKGRSTSWVTSNRA